MKVLYYFNNAPKKSYCANIQKSISSNNIHTCYSRSSMKLMIYISIFKLKAAKKKLEMEINEQKMS